MKALELSAGIVVDAMEWVGKSLAKLGGVVGWNGVILLCFVATIAFILCAIFDVWGERQLWTIPAICFAGVTLMFVVAVYGGNTNCESFDDNVKTTTYQFEAKERIF